MLSSIPLEDTSSVRMVTFSSQQTLIYDRDSLVLEGEELIIQERATPEDSMIAIFHYDANSDMSSDGDVVLQERRGSYNQYKTTYRKSEENKANLKSNSGESKRMVFAFI